VWAKPGAAAPVMRRLGTRSDVHNLYSLPWLKSVREIEFDGRFPTVRLKYVDEDLPVEVTARMISPLVPHDSRTSGTPGFYAVFTLRNTSSETVEASLVGALRNPLAWGAADRRLANSVEHDGDTAILTMRTDAEMKCPPTLGSMSLAVAGGSPSWITGEFAEFMAGYPAPDAEGLGVTFDCYLNELRATGRLPNLAPSRSPASLLKLTDEEIDAMPLAAKKRLAASMARHPFARVLQQRLDGTDRKMMKSDAGLAAFLKSIRLRLDRLAGKDRAGQAWGDAALASTVTLAPQEEKQITFVLAWHFPNHFSEKGHVLGHMYENWFDDAEDAAIFMLANREPVTATVGAFADALFDTSLDPIMADAWAGQLTTLVKCTWWTKADEFAVWEGLGCCGFHTTDITYQGSFNILAMYPDLQKKQMAMGAKFQRKDGRVHHFFTPDLSSVDNGFGRVDMNPQFVLLVARDYLWTGDRAYLKRMWSHIVRAMDSTAILDGDGDGLPDSETRWNTYDAWHFYGTPSYIASLWLSALMAASRVADELGHKAHAARWRKLLKKGTASFEKRLWNGEYYSLWVDGKDRDECCMTDQIDGEWFTSLVGLGSVLPRERILAALKAVVRYNYTDDNGLANATYPPGRKPRLKTFENVQATAPWTGIEYSIASMMLDFGMVGEAWSVIRNIHERYMRAGRFWNHVECGDHYYRAMSSWAVLLAATGFKIDVPRGSLTIAPRAASSAFRAPWVSSTGWGTFRQTADGCGIFCQSGTIAFKELRLAMAASHGDVCVHFNDKHLSAAVTREDDMLVVRFKKPVVLATGDAMLVG